ncbi:MAG: hypothetical protein FJY88_08275 [Candidatus Eisenbacteria bacterium]|nr:hypothetical protein [Candidatus Eisenbacteria bacterium]
MRKGHDGGEARFLLLSLAVLLVAILIGYGGALRNGFVSDDQYLIEERYDSYISDFTIAKAFGQSFWKGSAFDVPRPGEEAKDYYRPLVTISYALDARIWGLRPFGYHLTNLILHAVCTLLVLLLFRRLGARREIALAAALLFAVHPIHVANVSWIAGRTDLVAALFLLPAVIMVGKHLDRIPRGAAIGERLKSPSLWIGLLLYLGALFSKEISLTFGGLVLLYALARRRQRGKASDSPPNWPWTELGLIFAVTVAYMMFRASVLGLPDFRAGGATIAIPFRAGMLPTVYAYYWKVLFLPGTLHFHVPFRLPQSAGDPWFLLSTAFLAIQVALAIYLFRKAPLAGLGVAWVLVSLLPVSHLVPLAFKTVVCEYWTYLPSIGFVLGLAGLAEWGKEKLLARRAGGRLPAGLAIAGALVAISLVSVAQVPARSAIFRTEEGLLLHTIKVHPAHTDSWVTLGAEYGSRGEYAKAYRHLREAIRRDPTARGAHQNLANLYHLRGDLDSAAVAYRKELEFYPYKDEARINFADVLIERGEEGEVPDLYREAIERYPQNRQYIPQRGEILVRSALDEGSSVSWPERERGLRLASGIFRGLLEATRAAPDIGTPLLLERSIETELYLGRADRASAICAGASNSGATFAGAGAATARARGLCALADLVGGEPRAIETLFGLWGSSPGLGSDGERLAGFYHRTGRTGLAIPCWRALFRAGRISAEQLNHMAVTAVRETSRSSPAADAAAIWELLLSEVPDYPFSLLNLGAIARDRGDRARGRSYWQRFLDLYPDRPEAAELRRMLAGL